MRLSQVPESLRETIKLRRFTWCGLSVTARTFRGRSTHVLFFWNVVWPHTQRYSSLACFTSFYGISELVSRTSQSLTVGALSLFFTCERLLKIEEKHYHALSGFRTGMHVSYVFQLTDTLDLRPISCKPLCPRRWALFSIDAAHERDAPYGRHQRPSCRPERICTARHDRFKTRDKT